MDSSIILFDGVCNLCNASVLFVIDRDPQGRFSFAPLQGERGRELLAGHGRPADRLDTIMLLEDGRLYERSGAALRIARRLSGLWPLLTVFLVVPAPLRDAVYSFIARRRYRWFGRTDQCRIPTPDLRDRFLDSVA